MTSVSFSKPIFQATNARHIEELENFMQTLLDSQIAFRWKDLPFHLEAPSGQYSYKGRVTMDYAHRHWHIERKEPGRNQYLRVVGKNNEPEPTATKKRRRSKIALGGMETSEARTRRCSVISVGSKHGNSDHVPAAYDLSRSTSRSGSFVSSSDQSEDNFVTSRSQTPFQDVRDRRYAPPPVFGEELFSYTAFGECFDELLPHEFYTAPYSNMSDFPDLSDERTPVHSRVPSRRPEEVTAAQSELPASRDASEAQDSMAPAQPGNTASFSRMFQAVDLEPRVKPEGLISMQSDHYVRAVDDLQQCLGIVRVYLPESRVQQTLLSHLERLEQSLEIVGLNLNNHTIA